MKMEQEIRVRERSAGGSGSGSGSGSLEAATSALTLQLSSLSGLWGSTKADTDSGPSQRSAGCVKSRQLVRML